MFEEDVLSQNIRMLLRSGLQQEKKEKSSTACGVITIVHNKNT